MKKNNKKTLKTIALGAGLVGAGLLSGNVANASEVQTNNSVDTIKAEMHKQQGTKQHLAVYRVQKGDTLSGIAEASGLTINKILEMNDIANPNLIHIGQLINLGYSSQANNFVAQKGQSVKHNAKSYVVPTSQKAQASMKSTKEVVSNGEKTNVQQNNQLQSSSVETKTQVTEGQKSALNTNAVNSGYTANSQKQQAVSGTASETPKVSNSNTTNVAPSYNNNGQQAQKPIYNQQQSSNQYKPATGGQVVTGNQTNTGSNSVTVDVPATGGQQQTQKPSTSKPSTGGQTNTGSNSVTVDVPATGGQQQTQKPSTSKPSTGGQTNTGSQNQQNQQFNVDKANQYYQQYVSDNTNWNGTWKDSNGYNDSDDGLSGYSEVNAPTKGGSEKFHGNELGDATVRLDHANPNGYKYGYSQVSKTDTGSHVDYYFWN